MVQLWKTKKSPSSGCKEDTKEVEKTAAKDSVTAEMVENSNTNQSTASEGGPEDSDSKGGSGHSSHGSGTRLTRSRANQGTPGPNEQGNDSPRDSSLSQCENANLEPPTKE